MDDALWMHDDLDRIVWQAKQKVCLDDFERLVGECRTVDRDLATHRPGWMLKRVSKCCLGQPGFAPRPEWSARRSEYHAPDLTSIPARYALENRTMLAINGHDLAAPM